jgi:hypothetical protein
LWFIIAIAGVFFTLAVLFIITTVEFLNLRKDVFENMPENFASSISHARVHHLLYQEMYDGTEINPNFTEVGFIVWLKKTRSEGLDRLRFHMRLLWKIFLGFVIVLSSLSIITFIVS